MAASSLEQTGRVGGTEEGQGFPTRVFFREMHTLAAPRGLCLKKQVVGLGIVVIYPSFTHSFFLAFFLLCSLSVSPLSLSPSLPPARGWGSGEVWHGSVDTARFMRGEPLNCGSLTPEAAMQKAQKAELDAIRERLRTKFGDEISEKRMQDLLKLAHYKMLAREIRLWRSPTSVLAMRPQRSVTMRSATCLCLCLPPLCAPSPASVRCPPSACLREISPLPASIRCPCEAPLCLPP